MVKTINNIILAVRFFRKVLLLRLMGCSHITTKGISLAGKYSSIDCASNSVLTFGSKVCLSQGSLLAVRKSAKITLGDGVFINRHSIIVAHNSINIENGVTIGPNCCIYDHDHDLMHHGDYVSSPIVIGENVWIGANVLIMKGVSIGKNTVIGAGSIITHNIPSNTVVVQKRVNNYKEIPNFNKA